MNKKSLIGNAVGVVLAVAVTLGAIKFSSPATVEDGETPAPAPAVVVDPNQAAVKIEAPSAIRVGELAVIDVSGSNADAFSWKVKPETKNFMVIDGGRRAVFSAEAEGEYLFFVSAAKGGTVDSQIHTIVVGKGIPVKSDLAAKVPTWISKVQSPGKRDEAIRLAQSFSSVAAMVTPTTPAADIVAMTVKSNRDALGGNIKAWEPFLADLQVELEARAAGGLLPNADAHVEAWRQISKALTDYAQSASQPAPNTTGFKFRGR